MLGTDSEKGEKMSNPNKFKIYLREPQRNALKNISLTG
jgi:hypothetical protein